MTFIDYRRVAAVSPGKHGARDWRVTFNQGAPTHGEILALLGMVFIAEDRYPLHGRAMLWDWLDRVFIYGRSPEAVLAIAAECDESKNEGAAAGPPPLTPAVRAHLSGGGQ